MRHSPLPDRQRMKAWIGIIASLAIAGCAANALTYSEPLQGSRARVRFATHTDYVTVLRGYDDADCTVNENEWMRLRAGKQVSAQPKKLGMPLWIHDPGAANEVYVDATRAHTFLFSGAAAVGTMIYQCGVPLTFRFEPDKDYEVTFSQLGVNCSVTVYGIVADAGAYKRTRLKFFADQATPEQAGCLAQFKKMRWQ
jgi:hypothetical protein